MNILVLSHEYPPIGGGGANACKYICNELVKLGHKVSIVTPGYDGDYSITKKELLTIYKIKCRRNNVSKSSFYEMFSYLKIGKKTVKKIVKGEKFDISFVFFGIPAGPIASYLKRKHHIPYLIRMGGGDVPGFQKRYKILYKILNPFIRKIWKNSSALVANSEGLKTMANSFAPKENIDVIYNGVDLKEFINLKKDYSTLKFLFVSRLIERKGLQFFIPIFKRIVELRSDSILTICGSGTYERELKRLVQINNISDNVNFIGHVEHDNLPKYYNSSNIFVLPSNKEGMPNVVIEAMASGLPILISNCEGSKELIKGNGFILDFEDVETTISTILDNVNIYNDMSLMSRQLCENIFNWQNTTTQYLKVINDILC